MVLKMSVTNNPNFNREIAHYLNDGVRAFGLEISTEQTEMFVRYYHLLVETNKKVNLTHITGARDVALKHFVDSLSCIVVEDFAGIKKMIDVGTGAGFPGIPLKIMFPWLHLTLLDSQKKRVDFLEKVINALDLKDVDIYQERAESFGRNKENREKYDLCLSRAVASLKILAELCLPLVKVGGKFLGLKGPDIEPEVNEAQNAINVLGGKIMNICKFTLPITRDGRSIVVIEKTMRTPVKYPRRPGIPAKRPL